MDRNGEDWPGDQIEREASRPGGAPDDRSGEPPADTAHVSPHETSEPLDSRTHFGGDGARHDLPAEEQPAAADPARQAHGRLPGDDGFAPEASSERSRETTD